MICYSRETVRAAGWLYWKLGPFVCLCHPIAKMIHETTGCVGCAGGLEAAHHFIDQIVAKDVPEERVLDTIRQQFTKEGKT
ncbi:MAG: hypothetical protein Q7R68_11140 [Nitrospirales bacterium]|nr:hypothetical protein [Nitrospirales bacterium]